MDVEKKTVFYDKLTYIYLEMPKFRKTEDELVTMTDKWLYTLKHLPDLPFFAEQSNTFPFFTSFMAFCLNIAEITLSSLKNCQSIL